MTYVRILTGTIIGLTVAGVVIAMIGGYRPIWIGLLIGAVYGLGWLRGRQHTIDALGNLIEADRKLQKTQQQHLDRLAELERIRKRR